jgi:hypothetical protein
MPATVESRIDAVARRDAAQAVAFTVFMWAVLLFVLVVAVGASPTRGITVALVASLVALGGFNTASMLALVRRYAANKELVYRPDIDNLERMRHERAQGRR